MNEQVWAELGIEPTQDLVAIKKAYALKLRVTRPDDDAEAYQRLRSAYEWAQQWTRWAREAEEEDEQSEQEPEPQTVETAETIPAPEESVAPAPADETVDERGGIGSEDLADWVQRLRARESGEVMAAWAQVQTSLHAIPFHLQAEASARLADLVITEPLLPVAIVAGLQHHFGWRDDFRVARQLGAQRTRALQEVLDDRIARAITDPEQLRRFAPFLHLQHLRRQSRDMAAFWFAFRMGDPLLQLTVSPEARKPRLVNDGDPEAPISSGWLVFWAGVARGLPLALLLPFVLAQDQTLQFLREMAPRVPGDHILVMLLKVLLIGSIPVALSLLGLCALWVVSALSRCIGLAAERGLGSTVKLRGHELALRDHPKRAVFGLALLACAALWLSTNGFGLDRFQPVALSMWVLGLMIAWPRESGHGAVALAAMLATGAAVLSATHRDSDWYAAFFWLPVWVLLACRLYALHREVPVLAWVLRPVTNSLNLADRYGYTFAMTPALIACVVAATVEGVYGSTVFMSWVLSILAMAWIQNWLSASAVSEIG